MKNFNVINITIVLSFLYANLYGQITITGKVTSANSRESLSGVSVFMVGHMIGTLTDTNGNYNLTIDSSDFKDGVLYFSSVGYCSASIRINNRSIIDVALEEAPITLEPIKIIAYIQEPPPIIYRLKKQKKFSLLRLKRVYYVYLIQENKNTGKPKILKIEKLPESHDKFINYLKQNIKYPQKAIEYELEGFTVVEFRIDSTKTPVDFKVIRSVDNLFDNEVISVIKNYPYWDSEVVTKETLKKTNSPFTIDTFRILFRVGGKYSVEVYFKLVKVK